MTIDDLASSLRQMAWQRAKAELLSIQCASQMPDTLRTDEEVMAYRRRADDIRDHIETFIRTMEARGWDT